MRVVVAALPPQQFFRPTPWFLGWAQSRLHGLFVYDVGAGQGHVADALLSRGMRVKALDLYPREGQSSMVVLGDGEDYPYLEDSAVMLCRPCHGSFVEEVVAQALCCRVGLILYVGLERNRASDLGHFDRNFVRVPGVAGESGESVWELDLLSPRA